MKRLDEQMILKLNKIFTSDKINIEEKKELIKLRKIYLDNLKINNISDVENKLYNNKTKEEKVMFEIARIKLKLFKKRGKENKNFVRFLAFLDKYYKKSEELTDEQYDDLVKNIIRIELELGMEIGLFEEFNNYFKNEVECYLDFIDNYDLDRLEEYEGVKRVRSN